MKILINRTDAIGDTILTTPVAKVLKEKFPDCHITFLVVSKSSSLLLDHPYIDDVKIYNRSTPFYSKIAQIISIFSEVKPTHYFFIGGGYLPNFIAWLMRVKFRGGLISRWHTFIFLNKGIRQKRSMVSMHEIEYNINLLSPLGVKYHYSELGNYVPTISVLKNSSENLEIFNKDLIKHNLDTNKKLIFIHPGMTGHTLNWSSRNYGRFIVKMEQKFPGMFNYIISHTPSDERFLLGLKDLLSEEKNKNLPVYFFNGQELGLSFYMSILSSAKLFLGPSTGTTHIATALNVPVIGIYSPIKVQSTKRWGPVGHESSRLKIAYPDVICGEVYKCALKSCPYYECMGKIEVEDIVKHATSLVSL